MYYRTLGKTGLRVSEIGHGMWGMGSWGDSDFGQSENSLQLSLNEGCNFYDSARAYGEGLSDKLLGGLVFKNPEKEIVAASKIPPKNRIWPARPESKLSEVFPFDYVIKTAEKFKKSLGKKSIDLLQYHVWDDSWANQPEFKESVIALKEKGLIKYFGISLNSRQPENGIKGIETGLVDTVQVIYNIFEQAPEDSLFAACEKHHIGVIARVPLDEGSLGGKLHLQSRFPKNDFREQYFGNGNLEKTLNRIEEIKKIVPPEMSLAELALRFILENKIVSTVIVGMRNKDHILNNFKTSDGKGLTDSLLQELKKHRWDKPIINQKKTGILFRIMKLKF